MQTMSSVRVLFKWLTICGRLIKKKKKSLKPNFHGENNENPFFYIYTIYIYIYIYKPEKEN